MTIFKRTAFLFVVAFALGSLGAFSMAPYNLFPLLFLSLGGLYVLLDRAERVRDGFFVGWFFAFGYFLFSLSWIANALLVEDNPYRWAWPLAICGMPFILAPFTATACAVIKRFVSLRSLSGFCGVVLILSAAEWLRGHMFTGFPWNLYGYTWADVLEVIQSTYWVSVYGLTALTIFWSMVAGFIWVNRSHKRVCGTAFALALLSFVSVFAYGDARVNAYGREYHDTVSVNIVAPYIPQHEKWKSSKMMENFFTHIRDSYPSKDSDFAGVTYIVWPETAVTSWLLDDHGAMEVLTQMLEAYNGHAYLFTGVLRHDKAEDTYYNALVMIDSQGNIRNTYDKHHLVPFGEYIPFGRFLPIPALNSFSAFGAGKSLQSLETPDGLGYSPLVCYESIFPNKVVHRSHSEKVDFLLNVTNDAWYYGTNGPMQHFVHARFRAIEEGIPMIRSANGGISAVVDPVGRSIFSYGVDQKLPKSL